MTQPTQDPVGASVGSLGELLLAAADRSPQAVHVRMVGADAVVAQTYAETAARSRRLARALVRAGVATGTPVAVLGEPGARQIESVFGVWLAGAALVPLDPEWEPASHGRALAKAGVRVGVATPGRAPALAEAGGAIPGFAVIDLAELDAAELDPAAAAADGAADSDHDDDDVVANVALPQIDGEARGLILFTSGTTGEPKAAVLRHRALLWNAAALCRGLQVTSADNLLAVLPLHHVFGLMGAGVVPAMAGASVTFPPSLKGPEVARAMRAAGVTVVPAVPQLVLGFDRALQARLLGRGALIGGVVRLLMLVTRTLRRVGLNPGPYLFRPIHQGLGPRLRLLGSAGAALDPEAALRLWSLGLSVIEGYGLTESGPALSFDDPARPSFGSVGRPLPGVELRIDAPDPSGVGEIVARSPSLFDGYLDNPEATQEMLRDGWLYTGDLGRLDAQGKLWITGRRREVIVLGSGKNVYPHEIEMRLEESPFIREACVVGLADDGRRGTDKLHAVLVPDLDALRAAGQSRIEVTLGFEVNAIGDRLPSHHRIVGLTVRQEPLPRTPLGKLRRFLVLEELQQQRRGEAREQQTVAEPVPTSRYWPQVEQALRQVSGHRGPIGPSSGIELDLGLDSLARIEALAALEIKLRTSLPEGFGAEALTAGEVLEAVEQFFADGPGEVGGFAAMSEQAVGAELGSLRRRLLRPLGWAVLIGLWWPFHLLARIGWRFEVRGREHLPAGPFLICPNHGSYLDAMVILMATPLRVALRTWALGDYEIFGNPLMRILGGMGNVIRLDAVAGLRTTLAAGGAVLRAGCPLVLFPEGARAPLGERLPFRRGAAILARTVGVPIVPARMEGVDRLLPRGATMLGFGHRVTVEFGPPIGPELTDGAVDPAQALTDLLRDRIEALETRPDPS